MAPNFCLDFSGIPSPVTIFQFCPPVSNGYSKSLPEPPVFFPCISQPFVSIHINLAFPSTQRMHIPRLLASNHEELGENSVNNACLSSHKISAAIRCRPSGSAATAGARTTPAGAESPFLVSSVRSVSFSRAIGWGSVCSER